MDKLEQQINFLCEIDQLKNILRRTLLVDGSRLENTAEHSWHLSTAVLVLHEHATCDGPFDLLKAIKMALLHDVVEVDAGDTFVYDESGHLDKAEREKKAAERIFGLLPESQNEEYKKLWEDFEEQNCPESRFVAAVDRFLPMFHNYKTQGHSWRKYGIRYEQVIKRNAHIEKGCPSLWIFAQKILKESVEKGYLAPPTVE